MIRKRLTTVGKRTRFAAGIAVGLMIAYTEFTIGFEESTSIDRPANNNSQDQNIIR